MYRAYEKPQSLDAEVYMRLFWVSYYTQYGDQTGTSILVPSNEEEYTYLERELQKLYGDDFGGIADYGEYEEDLA